MAIAKKPKPQFGQQETHSIDIDALINKGGSIALEKETKLDDLSDKTKQIALHVPMDLFDKMEILRCKRLIKLPRHTWILEAINEKITKEFKVIAKKNNVNDTTDA